MARFLPVIAVFLATIIPPVFGAGPRASQRGITRVSVVKLNHAMKLDHQTLIVVPLEDCAIVFNGQRMALKSGDHKEFSSGDNPTLGPVGSAKPRLALIEVVASSQALTITSQSLASHQELEDASDRNQTLVVALNSLELRDKRNLAAEGQPWKSSETRSIRLHGGETAWLNQGMHRVKNARSTVAKFITIEW